MNKNIKLIEKLKKENNKLKEQKINLSNLSRELYHNDYTKFCENDNKIIKIDKDIELNNIKLAILKNNLYYLIAKAFEEIKKDIVYTFENKNIGEKTKENLQEKIQKFYNEKYNIDIRCWINLDKDTYYHKMELDFYFLNAEGYNSYILDGDEHFSIYIEKWQSNNYETTIRFNHNIETYVELENLNKTTKFLHKEYTKTINKIDSLKEQQKQLYHQFFDTIHGCLYKQFKIDTNISIY